LTTAQGDLNPKNRQELKREDVAGTNMEVVISVVEAQPGELLARHIRHDEEAFDVLQGAALKHKPASKSNWGPGATGVKQRDVPHAGMKTVGDRPLKY
jgi:hypothetical protein